MARTPAAAAAVCLSVSIIITVVLVLVETAAAAPAVRVHEVFVDASRWTECSFRLAAADSRHADRGDEHIVGEWALDGGRNLIVEPSRGSGAVDAAAAVSPSARCGRGAVRLLGAARIPGGARGDQKVAISSSLTIAADALAVPSGNASLSAGAGDAGDGPLSVSGEPEDAAGRAPAEAAARCVGRLTMPARIAVSLCALAVAHVLGTHLVLAFDRVAEAENG